MDEEFQKFLHSQFSEAHTSHHSSEQLSELIIDPEERYVDKEFFAEGGQKKIFKCIDSLTGRVVAYATVKDINARENVAKFIREARLTAHLEHRHIIPVYDTGLDEDNAPFFTMKLISGHTFEDHLNQQHDLNSKIDILIKICDAINFSHNKGIIHFDLKPDNIQVSDYGEALLCDWGLSGIAYENCSDELLNDELLKKVDLSQSLDCYFKGTIGYAAPEMSMKNIHRDHLADIYSLGAILYRILSKQRPDAKPILSKLQGPEALQAVCAKALSSDKESRYQSAREFLTELQAWRNGFATKAEKASFLTQLKLLVLRNQAVSWSALASIVVISLLTIGFISSLSQKEKQATSLASALQETEQERINLEKELAPKYLENAYLAYEQRNYGAVINLANHILRNNDSPRAKELIGLVHLDQQNFTEALPYINGRLKKLVKEYKDKTPFSVEDLISFISQVDRSRQQTEMILYKNLLLDAFEKNLTTEDKKQLIIAELLYKHPKLIKVNIELDETPEGLIIDLSNNPRIREIWILQKLGSAYIKKLDLSFTPVNLNIERVVDQLQIEELLLRSWPKHSAKFLEGRRILSLDVSNSKLDISEHIENMPLVKLNISKAPFKNWGVLNSLKFLKTLTVSKGQIPENIQSQLSKSVQVIEK